MFSSWALWLRVLLALFAALGVSFAMTPAVRAFACRVGAMDVPGEARRIHDHPIPRLGGLAIFIGFLVGVLPFTPITVPVQGILLGCVIIVVAGVVDDLISLRPWIKLLAQLAAAGVAVAHGVTIHVLTNPAGIHQWEFIVLGALAVPFTLVWIVGVTNAVNLIDGLDGLAVGVSAISCTTMLVVSLLESELPEVSVILGALAGACVGFMPYNLNPAKIFMGDTGAMLLGYVLATVSILGLFKMYAVVTFAIPVLALAVPLSDTIFAIVRRLIHGQNPMKPDRSHLHHRLLALGLNQKQAVAVLYAISAILGLAAVVLAAGGAMRMLLLAVAFLIAVAVWLYVFRTPPAAHTRQEQDGAEHSPGKQEAGPSGTGAETREEDPPRQEPPSSL